MPANQLSVSFSYTYSSELQAVKSAISVIQLYILQNLRPLASSFWKQCAFVCWSLLHLWVAQSGSQYMPCPCKKERGKVRAEVTCMHIDSGCCICCLYFLWPNYCLVSGRKGFSCVATGGHALFKLSLLLQASYNLTAGSSSFLSTVLHDLDLQKTEFISSRASRISAQFFQERISIPWLMYPWQKNAV